MNELDIEIKKVDNGYLLKWEMDSDRNPGGTYVSETWQDLRDKVTDLVLKLKE